MALLRGLSLLEEVVVGRAGGKGEEVGWEQIQGALYGKQVMMN